MVIGKILQQLGTKILSLKGVSKPQMISSSIQNLTRPDLMVHVSEISHTLSISEKETKSVLSLYEEYLKSSHALQNIDFSAEGIKKFIQNNFIYENSGYCNDIRGELLANYIKTSGFDILKDIVRCNTSKCSMQGQALHHDLKYLGLDPKSADIVKRFEESGINLITSSKNKNLNQLLDKFLDKVNRHNLPKPKEINLLGHNYGNSNTLASFNGINEEITFNPRFLQKKGYKLSIKDETGKMKTITEKDNFEIFIHEYFHLAHQKQLGIFNFLETGSKSLFEYLIDKKEPNLSKLIDDINDEGFMLINNIREQGRIEDLDKFIAVIRNHASEIFQYQENPQKCLQAIEEAYNETKAVAAAIRPYATATPLETVAEGGTYRYFGKKLPSEVDNLLNELGCPAI